MVIRSAGGGVAGGRAGVPSKTATSAAVTGPSAVNAMDPPYLRASPPRVPKRRLPHRRRAERRGDLVCERPQAKRTGQLDNAAYDRKDPDQHDDGGERNSAIDQRRNPGDDTQQAPGERPLPGEIRTFLLDGQ